MFGSVLRIEDIIECMVKAYGCMMNVPFIGKLNTVFIIAIGFGMGIILLCMIFNIYEFPESKGYRERYGLIPTLLQALYSMDPQ